MGLIYWFDALQFEVIYDLLIYSFIQLIFMTFLCLIH